MASAPARGEDGSGTEARESFASSSWFAGSGRALVGVSERLAEETVQGSAKTRARAGDGGGAAATSPVCVVGTRGRRVGRRKGRGRGRVRRADGRGATPRGEHVHPPGARRSASMASQHPILARTRGDLRLETTPPLRAVEPATEIDGWREPMTRRARDVEWKHIDGQGGPSPSGSRPQRFATGRSMTTFVRASFAPGFARAGRPSGARSVRARHILAR